MAKETGNPHVPWGNPAMADCLLEAGLLVDTLRAILSGPAAAAFVKQTLAGAIEFQVGSAMHMAEQVVNEFVSSRYEANGMKQPEKHEEVPLDH